MKIVLDNLKIEANQLKDLNFALVVDSRGNLTLHEKREDNFGNTYYLPYGNSMSLSSIKARVFTPNQEVAKKEIEKYLLPTGKFDTLKSISCIREIRNITGLGLKESKHIFEEVVSYYLKAGEKPL